MHAPGLRALDRQAEPNHSALRRRDAHHVPERAGENTKAGARASGNLTRGPDGRWTALGGRHLCRQAKAAGYLYQAVLRRELTERLGLEWDLVQEGVADARGCRRR